MSVESRRAQRRGETVERTETQKMLDAEKAKQRLGQATDVVTDFIPGVSETKDIISLGQNIGKGQYLAAGVDAVALGLGAVPVAGDIARRAFKTLANKFIKTKKVDSTVSSQDALKLSDSDIDNWKIKNQTSSEFQKKLKGRDDTLQGMAQGLKDKVITKKEYREAADAIRPIRTVKDVPKPASFKDTLSALDSRQRKNPIVGVNYNIPEGDKISARLDITAYTQYDTWIPTLKHEGKTMYKPSVVLKDVTFIKPDASQVAKALNVATGKPKAPFAVMEGKYVDADNDSTFKYAKKIFKDKDVIQIGYDPTRRGFFYDRKTGNPVLEADEVVQVGHLVLAKKAKIGNPDDFFYSKGGNVMDNEMLSFSELERFRKENDYYHDTDPRNPMNTEGMDLANPEVQKKIIEELNDRKKLDVISEMPISRKAGQRIKERRLEEALEKGKALKINKGGSIPQQMEMFSEGGLKDEGNTIDPVSGNEVPPGATQEEVRDDIPAQLSEGEFVFPADVVRYIGLEKLMMMRQEAKAGLARMEAMGQMGNADEATLPDDIPFTLDDLDTREETEDDVIRANIGTFVPPKFPTSQPYNPNVNPYQPTGVVPTPYMPYQPAQAEQILQPAGSGTGQVQTELRRYVNKETGQVRMIPFNKATGTSLFPIDSLIQQGFVREDEAPKAEAPKTTKIQTAKVKPVDTSSSDGMPDKTGGAVDATGISLNRGLIKNENLTNFLNTVTPFQQFKSTFKGPVGAGIDRFALGVSPRTEQYEMGVIGGVLDSFRGGNVEFKTRAGRATGKYNDITKLHEMNEDRQNQIGIVGNAVVEIMKPVIYDYDTKTKQYNKKSDVEITKSLKAKADILGIPTTYRGTNIRNTTLARDIAKKLAEDAVRINDKYGDTTHAINSLKAQENRELVARNEARAAETFKDSIPTSFEPGDYDGGDGTDVGGGDVSFVGDDPAFKQGGLVSKKKPKVKKMKRGGLASR